MIEIYRQYENPYELGRRLEELQLIYNNAKKNNADEDTLIELSQDINDLKERINFAWADDEHSRE